MVSTILSYVGWSFLPSLVTRWVQAIYYGITIRAGDPKPQPGTPRHQKHRRRIHMMVVISYLLYTIYEADYWIRQNGDFYQVLGVPIYSEEKTIRSRFRRLAALHHPDKVQSDNPTDISRAETHFRMLKTAQDTLSDPIKRFAYERFGPDMLDWQHCSSMHDYISRGLQTSSGPLYGGSILFLGILGFTGYLQWGRFWRYYTFSALVLLEMYTISRPYPPTLLTKLCNPILGLIQHPPLLPFQLLTLARKATFTLFIALSQLGGILIPSPPSSGGNLQHDQQQLLRLENIAKTGEIEVSRLLAMDMAPFTGDYQGTNDLKGKIREWMVINTIRADPEVHDAMGRALVRRRSGAPPGARI